MGKENPNYGDWEYECAKDDALLKKIQEEQQREADEIEAELAHKGNKS